MPVNNNKMIERNIELSAEFSRYLFDHPELGKTIPSDSEIVLRPKILSRMEGVSVQVGTSA